MASRSRSPTRPELGFPVVPKRSSTFRLSCKKVAERGDSATCDATLILLIA